MQGKQHTHHRRRRPPPFLPLLVLTILLSSLSSTRARCEAAAAAARVGAKTALLTQRLDTIGVARGKGGIDGVRDRV